MPLVECKFAVAPGAMELIDEQTVLLGDSRWTVWEDRVANRAWVTGFFESWSEAKTACRKFTAVMDPASLVGGADCRELADADWADSYKAHFKAWHIGRRYWVPEWERKTRRILAGQEIVWLDPGLAFGTGNHESTRLCCERLVEYIDAHKRRISIARDRSTAGGDPCATFGVIDAGCGSGILGISAFRFGLGPVIGFDNDPVAVRVSRENAQLNEVADDVEFVEGDLSTGLAGRQAGLVLANIHTDVLRQGAQELLRAVAPGGWLALSGILASEIDDLRADFLAIAEDMAPRKSNLDQQVCKIVAGASWRNRGPSTCGWRATSRRLGEWADLLMIRGP
jgi:ribosomal protein L11 methyltransferase